MDGLVFVFGNGKVASEDEGWLSSLAKLRGLNYEKSIIYDWILLP